MGLKKTSTFAIPFRQAGTSSLIILKDKYKQVPRNKKIIESVNSFGIKGVRFKLRNKEYTKKSLILAQDER